MTEDAKLIERATIALKILVGNSLKPGPLPGWLSDADKDLCVALDRLASLSEENEKLRRGRQENKS
jgi:hypothetical protein